MRFVAITLAALLLSGCGMSRAPMVTVTGAEITGRTDEGLELKVLIELENPNQEPLPLDSFQYHVSINGTSVFRGRRSPESTLGARSRRTIALPVPVLYSRTGWDPAAPPRSFDVSIAGTLLYVTPGRIAELLLDTGVHRPSVGFSGSIQVE